jgi:hypothetical protein
LELHSVGQGFSLFFNPPAVHALEPSWDDSHPHSLATYLVIPPGIPLHLRAFCHRALALLRYRWHEELTLPDGACCFNRLGFSPPRFGSWIDFIPPRPYVDAACGNDSDTEFDDAYLLDACYDNMHCF